MQKHAGYKTPWFGKSIIWDENEKIGNTGTDYLKNKNQKHEGE